MKVLHFTLTNVLNVQDKTSWYILYHHETGEKQTVTTLSAVRYIVNIECEEYDAIPLIQLHNHIL